ncbi:hypothetical protein HOLleu_25280 [Holothuria leucospilota]|uniref:Uncharacterized protein n=1 Tax=Holothuria leucospilota TaxID=206669 RepID=A0A9Q1BSF5_HOLLE|nr:hypothetical protein HOLleu_25280 [Holothuria leucospilota]
MEHCKCTKCCIALHNQNAHDGVNDHSYCADGTHACFTKRKDRGGLRKARDDVFKIVKTTDNVFRCSQTCWKLMATITMIHSEDNNIPQFATENFE